MISKQALWDVINRYAVSVGGDPSRHVHGNTARMQAVVEVEALIGKHSAAPVVGPLPVNPLCAGVAGRSRGACGAGGGNYCSNRCWLIGRLAASWEAVRSYERQLGLSGGNRERHVAHVELDLTSLWREGSTRTAVCSCGWRGPQRITLELVTDDALLHERES